MTDIVVQVRSEAGQARSKELLESTFGLPFQPLFPGTSDSAMRSWFLLTLPVDVDPRQAVSELAGNPAVASAFVKPPEAQP